MEEVLGIGGVFFKARDPQALAAWYRQHLGVPVEPEQTYGTFTSAAAGEQAVWSAFPARGGRACASCEGERIPLRVSRAAPPRSPRGDRPRGRPRSIVPPPE